MRPRERRRLWSGPKNTRCYQLTTEHGAFNRNSTRVPKSERAWSAVVPVAEERQPVLVKGSIAENGRARVYSCRAASDCSPLPAVVIYSRPGSNSVVESRLPKLSRFAGVEPAGEIPSECEGPRTLLSGSNSVVESRLPKPLVAGSIPVSRSSFFSFSPS